MRESKLFGLVLAGLLAAGLADAGTAQAQRAVTIASLLGQDKPETLVWNYVAQKLEERLPGQLELRIATDATLGGEREVAEGARLGSIHGSLSTLANMSAWVPEGQVFDMPFVFRGPDHIERVLAGPIGEEFRERYRAEGFRVLGFVNYGARHLLAKEPIEAPGAMAGQRIRVIQSPLHMQLWESLGANPTPIPIPEVYNALQTGVVDMMDLTKSAYVGFRLHEVVPYLIETGHIWALGILFVAEDFFQSLTPEQQQAFLEIGPEAAAYFNGLMAEDQAASMARAESEGAQVVAVELQAWQAAIQPFWEAFADNVGGIERIRAIAETQ